MGRHKNNNNESLYRLPEKDPLSQEVLESVFLQQTVAWHLQTGKRKTQLYKVYRSFADEALLLDNSFKSYLSRNKDKSTLEIDKAYPTT